MTITEKAAYLKGLVDGLELGDTKESKVIKAMVDLLDEMALSIDDLEVGLDELGDQVDSMDEDLQELTDDLYSDLDDEDEDDEEMDFDDEELYEVVCPSCGDTICVNEEMLDEGQMECPNCGELLEFDLDIDEGCSCGCHEWKDDKEEEEK